MSDIERPADMRRLLNVVAAQMASLAVPAAIADRLQVPVRTVRRYLDLLELLFVIRAFRRGRPTSPPGPSPHRN